MTIRCDPTRQNHITINHSGGNVMSMKKNLFFMMSQYGQLLSKVGN